MLNNKNQSKIRH